MCKIQIKNESRSKITNPNGETESLHVSAPRTDGNWQRTTTFDKELQFF